MAALRPTAAAWDLASPAGRLHAARQLMDAVYGGHCGADPKAWRPRSLAAASPGGNHGARYLWTDAFGVVNFVTLAAASRAPDELLDRADALVDAVHEALGRARPAGAGAGPPPRLPGASAADPTAGGLRIGKAAPEGHPDGDGQYFHYNTKWAYALLKMHEARRGQPGARPYLRWAAALVAASHAAFVSRPAGGGRPRMAWKRSVDLSRAAVPSEGNLDPYDGLVTVRALRAACAAAAPAGGAGGAAAAVEPAAAAALAAAEADFAEMVAAKYPAYASDDPLDLGEALWLCAWADALAGGGGGDAPPPRWAAEVRARSLRALERLYAAGYFDGGGAWRLGFREMGASLGLQAAAAGGPWPARVAALHARWAPRAFARDADITPVMVAASLAPGAWLPGFEGVGGPAAEAGPEA